MLARIEPDPSNRAARRAIATAWRREHVAANVGVKLGTRSPVLDVSAGGERRPRQATVEKDNDNPLRQVAYGSSVPAGWHR